ncbi:glycoside hydrolase superfamily [Cladorrhinum sp. PSN259]|nr:glycoside hydrolase superfamily [Cladorrhinum sp. PSN259]
MASQPGIIAPLFRQTLSISLLILTLLQLIPLTSAQGLQRSRESLNPSWRFQRFTSNPDSLSYAQLKPFLLPTASNFVSNPSQRASRPSSKPPNSTYAEAGFNDASWPLVNLPHDWAISGPFYVGSNTPVGGGMGRLPSQGVGWYRRRISVSQQDLDTKAVYLEVDGAMSYASVWVNGVLVGGWPYGYASWRVEITPYLKAGEDNQLGIRLDQALDSSRWYPGAGIYRNVWLVKAAKTHVAQWGTYVVTDSKGKVDLKVDVENAGKQKEEVVVVTEVYELDGGSTRGKKVGEIGKAAVSVGPGEIKSVNGSLTVSNPKLWGPRPGQEPNLHLAVTRVLNSKGEEVDSYETRFGIRSVTYAGDGVRVNGQRVYLQGVCQHHDLGSLGSAFNVRAAERQLEMLQDMGSTAIRTSHNPPAPELLDLADRMGFLVLDEIFDTWGSHKVKNDFQTIFAEWSEPDLRAFIRRDRNHPSVWAWSFGNEVAEQTSSNGAATATRLRDIVHQEDPTRYTAVGMNNAGPNTSFVGIVDMIGLNYQGEGKGNGGPTFENFRGKYPNKLIFSSESSSVVSSRGTYLFPVTPNNNEIVKASGTGTDPKTKQVSSYELYAVEWGASPDKVFAAQDRYPYVAGEFVWTGWDYIGEPTPFDSSRSSYFGIIDLAGFPKDRFYLYQARWNPNVKMAHILPHWNWPDRVGQVTPVHVFSSGDEAELFVNGKSQGRIKKAQYTYRFRWDKVTYQPGDVKVVTYKEGKEWATASIKTTGNATALRLSSYKDRTTIKADGNDLSFLSVAVVDDKGDVVPTAEPKVTFSIKGPGEIVSTDNGDPTDFVAFPSKERNAFRGLALAIVKARAGGSGPITVSASAPGVKGVEFVLNVE